MYIVFRRKPGGGIEYLADTQFWTDYRSLAHECNYDLAMVLAEAHGGSIVKVR